MCLLVVFLLPVFESFSPIVWNGLEVRVVCCLSTEMHQTIKIIQTEPSTGFKINPRVMIKITFYITPM